MFGIGWTEMLVVAAVALMVMGEDKFPDFAKVVIRAFKDFRGYWEEIRHEVEKEVRKPLEKELKPLQRELQKLSRLDEETYTRRISPTSPSDAPGTSPDMGTPPETPVSADPYEAANVTEPVSEFGDEPVTNPHPDDMKILNAGTTPYYGGGPGARAETAATAEASAECAAQNASTDAPAGEHSPTPDEHDALTPPSRLD